MRNPHGSFIWYELLTTDPAAAGAFYAEVIGWSVAEFGGFKGYHIFSAEGGEVAGMMALPPEAAGMPPGWLGYVGVDDVDAAVADIVAAGGAVHMTAMDLPEIGRMALVADPQGVPFYVMRGASDEPSRSFDPTADGHCAWHQLGTPDPAAALGFYGARFGWTKGGVMNMGEMGDYQFIDHAGQTFGAMMRSPDAGPPPMWTYYFRVPAIDAAASRIRAAGGTILFDASEIPGGEYILIAQDPQGAPFALVGKRVEEVGA
jgi:predicted enzyme related to lactoylglutathione lyase